MLYFDSSLGTNHEFGYSLGTSLGTSESLDMTCFYTNIYIFVPKKPKIILYYIYRAKYQFYLYFYLFYINIYITAEK